MFLFVTRRHQMTRGNEIRVFALCFIKAALEQSKILFLRFRHEHFCLFVFKLYYSYPIKSPVATTDGRCNHHTNRQRINHHLGSFLYDRRYNAYCNTRYENQKPVSLSLTQKKSTHFQNHRLYSFAQTIDVRYSINQINFITSPRELQD